MTSDRPYRGARPARVALDTLRDRHYEGRLVDALDQIVASDALEDDGRVVFVA